MKTRGSWNTPVRQPTLPNTSRNAILRTIADAVDSTIPPEESGEPAGAAGSRTGELAPAPPDAAPGGSTAAAAPSFS